MEDHQRKVHVLPSRKRLRALIVPEAQHTEEVGMVGPPKDAVNLIEGQGDGTADHGYQRVLYEIVERHLRSDVGLGVELDAKPSGG